MSNDTNKFYHELKTHLESFRQQEPLPKPESTGGGRRVSVLRRQEGAPVLLG